MMHNSQEKYQIFIIPLLQDNYSFIFKCNITGVTACIDPATGPEIADFLDKNNLKLDFILNTHHHFDHIGGNKYLKDKYGCKIIGNGADAARIPEIDILVNENDLVNIGQHSFKVIDVTGHTIGHIAYFNPVSNILFIGDTLFSSGSGRVFEGSYADMYNSLEKIKLLPDNTLIYCAHEYTINNIKFALTLEPNNKDLLKKYDDCQKLRNNNLPSIPTNLNIEKKTNPFLRTLSKELRKSIDKTSDAYNVDIFAYIRKMKDNF